MRVRGAFLLCVLFAACGGDDDGDQPTRTATPVATATTSATPVATATIPPASPTATIARTPTAAATATQTATGTITATPEPTGTVMLTIHDEFLTSTDQMIAWISTVVEQGIRRPGYPADQFAEQFILDQFTAFGLENPTLDPIEVKRWEPRLYSLTVWPDAAPLDVQTIPCFPLPFSAPTLGLEGALLAFPPGPGVDAAGKIAVVENLHITLPQTVTRLFSSREYDPDGEFDTISQVLPFSFGFQNAMGPAIAAGAAGFIGIITGVPFDTHDYFVPYDAIERPIPGVWISASDGARLKALIAAGPVSGRIVTDTTLERVTSHNVVATLPGASDEWIVIGSHHDGPWASAVEDGSGIAMVLAQARYWSQVPRHERPHNLMFVLNGGHMSGGAGLAAFLSRYADRLDEIVLELHLEHAAREARGEDGRLVATDKPEIRWWFTSRITPLEDAVEAALQAEDLRRSFIMQPDGFPPGAVAPPTDGAFFHPAGVPIVNFLTAPMYLFDAQDTIDKVHEPSLVPVTRAAIRIINALQGRSAAELRSLVRPPPTPG
jgi:hypothetical protein